MDTREFVTDNVLEVYAERAMSQIRLVVRETESDWSGVVPDFVADHAIAALSADPVTFSELDAACSRYAGSLTPRPLLGRMTPGLCDDPFDVGIVIIDLVAKLVIDDSPDALADRHAQVCYVDGDTDDDIWLPYHLDDEWRIETRSVGWRQLADDIRRERAASREIDVRAVLFGKPMWEFIAREIFEARLICDESQTASTDIAATEGDDCDTNESDVDNAVYQILKQIHANWLLRPRDDLGGVCPREAMLQRHDHITWDLQDQCMLWSRLDRCPPGIDRSSHAFRYGGFGTHELVKYYDLIRELLSSCWLRMVELDPKLLTVGDFLTAEVPRLEREQDRWLDTPDPECHGRTPRSIIDRERARLPEGMSGHEAIVDEDCPCCQMLADMPGPTFWHLDGCNMDDEFAFSIYHRTREDWEKEEQSRADFNRRFNAEWAERERLGVDRSEWSKPEPGSVWACSVSVGDDEDVPLGIRLFGIGCRLAEVISDIRLAALDTVGDDTDSQGMIDQLNRDFGNLREILLHAESSVSEVMIQPVIDRFSDTLTGLAASRPHLSEKCTSLASCLAAFLDPQPVEEDPDTEEDDYPF